MLAVLNVSLDEKICQDPSSRFRIVMDKARSLLAHVCGEVQQASYQGPDGQVTEDCAVIMFEVTTGMEVIRDAIDMLARQLGQDCVAAVFADGYGCTIGPKSARWPFDRDYFNMPSVFKAHQNAGSI